ncbi:MAG: hypothetical protein AAGK67_05770 [Pseudomonadota bacterium]
MGLELAGAAGLWLAVLASGLYHGANPGMGWPLAVSGALFERKLSALWRALAALGVGHVLAMAVILLPFAVVFTLQEHQREIRIGAALIVTAMGIGLLIWRRHPRFLSRVKPSRLALWSFLVATAHGAGLMLLPIYLGLCGIDVGETKGAHADHLGTFDVIAMNAQMAMMVALAHTLAMILSGGAIALAVHQVLGLKFVSTSWFNLDMVWALSLVVVGGISLWAVV